MQVALEHHYGCVVYDVPHANTLEEAAYLAVRHSHTFLTPDNHTYAAGPQETFFAGKTMHWNAVLVYRAGDAPAYSGPAALETTYWFAVNYRKASEINSPYGDVVKVPSTVVSKAQNPTSLVVETP